MNVLLVAASLYAALVALAFAVQRRMMYPAPRAAREPALPGAAVLRIAGDGGRSVYAFYLAGPAGAPVVVHFHGNGEALEHQTWLAEAYHESGLGFLAVEYPGYGLASASEPSKEAILADAERAIRHLHHELGVTIERTVLEGQSLGTGVAAEMAKRGLGARLILVSAYTSTVEVAQSIAPILPMRLILRDQFDTDAIAPEIRVPTLMVHGERDTLIPSTMGRRLAGRIAGARFFPVASAGHNDVFERGGSALWREMTAFAAGG